MTTNRTLLTVAACVGALAACGDAGPFSGLVGDGNSDPPEVLELNVPESVTPNDILRVQVVAKSEAGIASMDIALAEGLRRDTTRVFDPPELDLDATTDFNVPGTVLPGTTINVTVTVTDRFEVESAAVAAEVLVVENDGF
ncbi:MAG TPA: hypothetical protein VMM83_06555 [Longimicrobiales bacterium]|nr:hypothetical protein [Longimicrobiales bacterium]